jgi:hypothetical protein
VLKIAGIPLIEFGSPVSMPFSGGYVPALRDPNSGYVFFTPPAADELSYYYNNQYGDSYQSTYYTVDVDYQTGKNCLYAQRILDAYVAVIGHAPRSSHELGCSYGGLVAEMAARGIRAAGSDINSRAIEEGKLAKGNSKIFAAPNLEALSKLSEPVDLIYSLHTLEHDPCLFEVILEAKNYLSQDGMLFVSVPNAMYANSIIDGFSQNWWARYPDHLHMLSPGVLPFLCDQTGFSPVFWDTRVLFHDPEFMKQLDATRFTDSKRASWELMMGISGFGQELNFAFVPEHSLHTERLASEISQVKDSLVAARYREVKIRNAIQESPAR